MDVFHAVKTLRNNKPNMVDLLVSVRFTSTCALHLFNTDTLHHVTRVISLMTDRDQLSECVSEANDEVKCDDDDAFSHVTPV